MKLPDNNTKADKLYPHTVDMYTGTADVWTKCFESTPSGYNSYNCEKCGLYSTPQSTVWLNLKLIWEHGFNHLQDAIPSDWKSTQCIKCHSQCTLKQKYTNHLFIEADARPGPSDKPAKHMLSDFPRTITLNCSIYRLRGVIGHQPGSAKNSHFIAYC
ncbi:PREDICTED: uncharacterized protein LOC108355426 [Rhagoletis zephyria]|uniref:uncharacterized protein LOC108355426 n=1 Tax=Rhagoletis zephyria TaxID=28612 RepID=UPI0008118CD7|nr:PREDICTED: uncharacterized protein LOC108355426 [Rhagoletis zephyria]